MVNTSYPECGTAGYRGLSDLSIMGSGFQDKYWTWPPVNTEGRLCVHSTHHTQRYLKYLTRYPLSYTLTISYTMVIKQVFVFVFLTNIKTYKADPMSCNKRKLLPISFSLSKAVMGRTSSFTSCSSKTISGSVIYLAVGEDAIFFPLWEPTCVRTSFLLLGNISIYLYQNKSEYVHINFIVNSFKIKYAYIFSKVNKHGCPKITGGEISKNGHRH